MNKNPKQIKGSPDKVRELYVEEGLTFGEIGVRLKLGSMTVWRYMQRVAPLTEEDRFKHLVNRYNNKKAGLI